MRSERMRGVVGIAVAVAVGVHPGRGAAPSPSPSPTAWLPADPDHRWSFPRDHFSHPGYRNEWWYFTGIVETADAPPRRFGYQVTFFRVGLLPQRPPFDSEWAASDAVMGHAAVTDLDRRAHVFSELLWRATPLLGGFPAFPDPTIAWAHAPAGTDGTWTLRLEDGVFRLAAGDRALGVSLSLAARPEGPPVLEGPNGYSRKAPEPGYASQYVSFPRLATRGTVVVGGKAHAVRGTTWMDHEIGSSELAPRQTGWDWFGLRLADGRDLMLYVMRRGDGSVDWRNGTLVSHSGETRFLAPDAWSVRATDTWRSPASGADYPAGWEIRVPGEGLALRVEPLVADQENRSRLAAGLSYWEGAVRVTDAAGRAAGEGYVELTGYGGGNRPPI